MANGIDFLARFPFISTVFASRCASWNLSPIAIALNVIQVGFLWRGAQDSKGFEISHKLQPFFNVANLAVNFWSFGYLVNELGKRFSIFDMKSTWSFDAQNRFSGYGYGAMLAGLVATIFAVSLVNKYADSSRTLLKKEEIVTDAKKRQDISISWSRPLGHDLAQLIYVSQLCLNIALAVFSYSNPLFMLNLAFNAYALYQFVQRKWLSIHRTQEWEIGRENMRVRSVEAVYRCYLMPVTDSITREKDLCTICQYEKPDAYFHAEHHFHEKCLAQSIVQKSDEFIAIHTFKWEEGIKDGVSYISYNGQMSNSCKPGCPNCREKPFFNELQIFVKDMFRGNVIADIEWVDRAPQGV